MKQGKTLTELAAEIERQAAAKLDLVADTRQINMVAPSHDAYLDIGHQSFRINDHAHRQIGEKMGIPAKYYDRLRNEAPELLAENVNHWLHAQPERRMVRTLDGTARAFLSDKYRRIDNLQIAQAVLPELLGTELIQVRSSDVTEKKLYLQAVFPKLEGEVKKGDVVQAGIVISNSEIGLGGFQVSPLTFRLVCLNGMITSAALKKYHVGKRVEAEEGSFEVFSSETLKADDAALMLKMRDVVRASMNQAVFEQQLIRLREATGGAKLADPVRAVEVLGQRVGLTQEEGAGVLTRLIEGADLSRYGLIQAVTALANDHASYDRAVELEQLGGRVLELNRSEWQELAEAT